ncbi:conserved hypothetical protein [Theileria equi strain WA]|uniref:Uncharacterized protein n=1 Tax=Theileria equi strain WA TaxID=1537102 RepID=L1LCX1_THEEQ|nr:conserved hypothetical protein [Theileria equi strain WA]EKX73023.1 conserved hypothetical protein [Theileria equi strain WA]|eukprot:XP_004832475.1 conserved hypothetical protein [Theileria equi strain WA]
MEVKGHETDPGKSGHGQGNAKPVNSRHEEAKDGKTNVPRQRFDIYGNRLPCGLTESMLSTLHYMKYREAIRRYTGEFRNCPYVVSALYIVLVICVILTTSLISQYLDPTDPGTIRGSENATWYRLYIMEANNFAMIVSVLMGAFTVANLYFCIHPNSYSKIACSSKVTIKVFFLLYPFLMVYNYHKNHTSIAPRAVYNIRAYNVVGNFHYDTILLTIFSFLLFFFNIIAFLYRFVYPHLLLTMINDDVKLFRVLEFEEVRFNVPHVPGIPDGRVPGYRIKLGRIRDSSGRLKEPSRRYKIISGLINLMHFSRRKSYDTYQYVGQLNNLLRPHGFGFWNSPNFHGELLMGFWEGGFPFSPFKSREIGTNSGFSNVVVGWVQCRTDGNMQMGVANAECCVSGPFFRTFPRIMQYYSAPNEDLAHGKVLKFLGISDVFTGKVSDHAYFTENKVLMTLQGVSNDIVSYRYGNILSYVQKTSLKKGKLRTIFNRPKQSKDIPNICSKCMECILYGLSIHTPYFYTSDASTLQVSLDDTNLYVHGYIRKNPSGNEKRVETSKDTLAKSDETESSPTHGQMPEMGSSTAVGVDAVKDVDEMSYDPQKVIISVEGNPPKLSVSGWVRREEVRALEAWVYIHGFNVSCIDSISIFGQIISFGNYPQYIKPFVFSWPSGSRLTQFRYAIAHSTSSATKTAFLLMLKAFLDNGIRDVHFMTHSMGATMFLSAFADILNSEDKDIFKPLDSNEHGNQLRILTVTLLNPFHPVQEFIEHDYPRLKKYCSHITIFSDTNDKALRVAEIITLKKRLGRCVNNLFTFSEIEDPEKVRGYRSTLCSIVLPFTMEESSLHRPKKDKKRTWLDVDVIDTTCLGSNVHAMRHSYWFLNREVMEDLRDLIVSRKRAEQRTSRLDRSLGNAWVYRVAPVNINTIFETMF